MPDIATLDHAIASHARWKSRLREAIDTGQCEITIDRARHDDVCDFGQWLHHLPPSEQATPRIRTLREMHVRFHKEAAHILELAVLRQKENAEAAMAPGSPFTHASTDLVMALTTWKVELLAAPSPSL
jgi:hypothetical protein